MGSRVDHVIHGQVYYGVADTIHNHESYLDARVEQEVRGPVAGIFGAIMLQTTIDVDNEIQGWLA